VQALKPAMVRRAITFAALSLVACNACNDPPPAASPASTASTASTAASGAASPPTSTTDTIIHVEDDGKSFDTYKGSAVIFKLNSNSGTGYVWTPTQVDASVLAQQGDRSTEGSSDTPGAPKLDVYRFVAGSAGTTVVEMSLKRPFGTAPAARAIHVTVNVH
jgi:predicted secreted protein